VQLEEGEKEILRFLLRGHGKTFGGNGGVIRLHLLQEVFLQFVRLRPKFAASATAGR
jgi:hypothetical protein